MGKLWHWSQPPGGGILFQELNMAHPELLNSAATEINRARLYRVFTVGSFRGDVGAWQRCSDLRIIAHSQGKTRVFESLYSSRLIVLEYSSELS